MQSFLVGGFTLQRVPQKVIEVIQIPHVVIRRGGRKSDKYGGRRTMQGVGTSVCLPLGNTRGS